METRRRFVTALGVAAAAPLAPAADAAPARKTALKPVKARVGHELQGMLTDKGAAYLARFGVDGVGCAAQMADPTRVYATVDELKRARDLCERHEPDHGYRRMRPAHPECRQPGASRHQSGGKPAARPRHRRLPDSLEERARRREFLASNMP